MLTKVRHEAFAQELARGKSQRQSALAAGFSAAQAESYGCRLAARPEIKERVAELREKLDVERAKAMSKVEMPTRQRVLLDLVAIKQKADAARNLQAELKAVELLGKELGMFVQRSEVKVDSALDGLNTEGLAALLAGLRQGDVDVIEGDAEEVLDADPLA